MASSGKTLHAGLIGFGLGGSTFHAPFMSITPGLRLAAVMTSDPARRAAAEQQYPDAKVVNDLQSLLALQLDLIAISTPNATHYPLARAALEAGAHVVVDKPFAATADQARAIGTLAASVGRLAIPFQNRRWDGDFRTLQRLIGEGALGDVHRFESRFDRWRPVPKPGWCRADAKEKAEDIVHDLGTHLVDQALVLFGPMTEVYAELNRLHSEVVTVDDAFIALRHESGVRSHLHMTTMAGVPGPRLTVFGSRASYVKYGLDVQEDVLRSGGRPGAPSWGEEPQERWGTLGAGATSERVPTLPGAYAEFYAGVARAIRDGAPPPVMIADVVYGLDVIEAAFRSAERREVVRL